LTKINPLVRAREAQTANALMSRDAAAHRLGDVDVRTIDRMIATGKLPKVMIGRRVLLPVAAIEALAAGELQAPTPYVPATGATEGEGTQEGAGQ
jgi:excisionase family DNA binding protein